MAKGFYNILFQLYPQEETNAKKWREVFLFGLFVFLFLLIFQPFGLREVSPKVLILLGYGGITSFVLWFLNFLLPKLSPGFYAEHRWVVWKEIVYILTAILLIALLNLVYSWLLGFFNLNFLNFLAFIGITLSLGVFPVTISVLIKYYSALRQNVQEAQPLHDQLTQPHQLKAHHEGNLVLKTPEGEVLGQWPIDHILRIEAAQNYVELYHIANHEMQRILLRLPLKEVEQQAHNYQNLIRTHRSHIVNLQHVEEVTGNAQGLQVYLDHHQTPVPVSRSRIKAFQEQFKKEL